MQHQPPTLRTQPVAQQRPASSRASISSMPDAPCCGACAGMPRFLSGGPAATSVNFGSLTAQTDPLTNDSAAESADGRAADAADAAEVDSSNTDMLPQDDREPAESLTTDNEAGSITGVGPQTHAVAYSLSLQGRTDATFSSSFRTARMRTRPAEDCANCSGSDCVHTTGTLVSRFRVATTVTLPRVADFPGLTRCQQQRVRNAIRNVLSPHEQEHVRAFRTYNGTVNTPIDLTVCRDELDAEVQTMHNDLESARQSDAQARSDALDPFEFEVDMDCEDR